MFCSTIIPTIGRQSLAGAVASVLTQEFAEADFEVIVVNDSGCPLPEAEWQHSPNVRILHTNRRERCVARNAGAAIARGHYLHFLDDDDILLPGAMAAFWQLAQKTGAHWLYGAYETVDNDGALVEQIFPAISGDIFALTVSGESLPFQCSLLQADRFHAVGGFDAHPAVLGVEDRDVGRRMAFESTVAYTPTVVAQIRIGPVGSTTNWNKLAEHDRWGREKSLRLQCATRRLRSSATSPYLRGRVTHACIASAWWNLERGNYLMAGSRFLTAFSLGSLHVLAPEFWQGLRRKRK
jgi:hypothetical protein